MFGSMFKITLEMWMTFERTQVRKKEHDHVREDDYMREDDHVLFEEVPGNKWRF